MLQHELRVAPAYGASFVNVHIGSHLGTGIQAGVKRVAEAVDQILDGVPATASDALLVLENSAGGGNGIGESIDELIAIHEAMGKRRVDMSRVGYCLDSAHLWGAGVEMSDLDELDRVIEEPMAAAIGAGLPIHEPTGNMVVDIGGGTTEVAVISLGGIVTSLSIRVGGDELDQSIINWVKREFSLLLGERTAEEIKMAIGSAYPLPGENDAEIRGRDLATGLPKTIVVSAAEIRKALEEPVNAIINAVKSTLDKCPPELASDLMDRGIVLTGGGALLKGLDERLRKETGMPIHVAERPLDAVVEGSGKCIEEFEALEKVLISEPRR